MSKAPTVSEVVVSSTVLFKPVKGSPPISPIEAPVKPDYDTDCLWKPMKPKLGVKSRTISVDSTDSEIGRKISEVNVPTPTSPVDMQPRTRRLSFTEMIFGSPSGGFSWGQSSSQRQATIDENGGAKSVTKDARFKALLHHQNSVLGEDGITSQFKKA